ncbi:DnaJ family domain-containing protein [Rhodobacter capsulatus]|jgi:hypothetical protein|uniref:DnaJ homologue subfamily C member 28 conserved domain-containing protein n=1 Tax=Rhodobacter capsulatus (strain ATCC BAA-309 / NBRC 16581 / SB1003) TaxID=272942 RepID=D5ANJ3_RHOCB|nr:DUF1992 domain-containing protein [Rhodobacter capsulatus]ADE84347.1 conserved hypothetical protein [Rhodobacter capsulatus SB 1003]ETD02664.1 molecular chaperone DnaJ [Rhodobacter capsulatus DE442]ETD78820.1 molecular chaperone DnaJ [Rhodobacter capsulatus R121]ETE54799.1 molecular chaperone DnaJ [Rhodobacter capsulatus Y262]MDS0926030.1 DUF1992 domain-containing protein [Rhodobacter capsulatus]
MKFSDMAERQILKAQAEGQFENLRGAGKPLNMGDNAGSSDAIGFRIMAEAGALPREIELRKAVEAQTEKLRAAPTEEDRRREARVLADLQLRLDIEAEARRRFYGR